MKILLTGATGLLGATTLYELHTTNSFDLHYLVHTTVPNFPATPIHADLRSAASLHLVRTLHPEVLIHCAAVTDVDYCEQNPEDCIALNVTATQRLAECAADIGAHFVFISSDQIFSESGEPHTEETTPTPLNNYGKSKVMAEDAVRSALDNHLIIRTNIFGINYQDKLSFSEWILSKAGQSDYQLFTDVYFNPLLTNTIAKLIIRLTATNTCGTFHASSDECISKYAFGTRLLTRFGHTQAPPQGTVAMRVSAAKRPNHMCLSNTKLLRTLNLKSLSIDVEIDKLYSLYQSEYKTVLRSKGFNADQN